MKNNYTQTMIAQFAQAEKVIQQSSRISPDQYSGLMFHHGTQFAEHFSRLYLNRNDVCKALQTDKNFGFWN